MPVTSKMQAPMAIAKILVSPMEPGIRPIAMSSTERSGVMPCATCPNGVAAVKPSGSVLPSPKMES